jgi:TPR repeat protein
MNRLPDHDLSAGFATKDEQEQKEEEHHEQEQEVSASSRLAENTGEQVHLSEDDNDDALADSDSEEVDRWVGHFLRTRVKDLAPPYGCRCDENATALSPFPPPPLPQNPDAIRDYLYWNDDENCKPWWEPLSQCVDSALGGDGDAQCVLGLKDIFTPEPPSRFSGRRQQAAPEASVWLVAAAKRSHPLALHVLAHCRRQGNPFPWTLPPAVEAPGVLTWFRALATAGEYYAQHTLSEMYLVGCGVERHPWKALVWACRALSRPARAGARSPRVDWPTSGGALW